MKKVLVIGASGFVGRQLSKALLAAGYAVRCLARNLAKVQDLASAGCELVQGDIADPGAVRRALDSVDAVYISIHTLSPQPGSGAQARFMEVEKNGVQNVIAACHAGGVRRAIYVTSLATALAAPSEWLRERWLTEQLLLSSGLDATVIQPGYIAGVGGRGFDTIVSQAQRRFALVLGDGKRRKMRTIALDDLVYYLVGVLEEPRAYGQRYEVGNDDVLARNELLDRTAEVLGRPHPVKVQLPAVLLGALAPLFERVGKLPSGALKGFVDGMKVDAIGNPLPIRALLPRPLLSFRQALERALLAN